MDFSEIDMIRFVKNFTKFCLDFKRMPDKSTFERMQFLYYQPNQLKVKTYKSLGLDSNKECFIVTSCYEGGKILFSTNNTEPENIRDMYETVSNYMDAL